MNSFLFGTGSHPVAQTDLDLKIFSPQLPRSRITREHAPGRDEEEEEMSVGAQGGRILLKSTSFITWMEYNALLNSISTCINT